MPKEIDVDLDAKEFEALQTASPQRPLMVVTDLALRAGDTIVCHGPDEAWSFASVLGSKRMEWDTVLALAKKR